MLDQNLFQLLPNDIYENLVPYLDLQDYSRLRRASKSTNKILSNDLMLRLFCRIELKSFSYDMAYKYVSSVEEMALKTSRIIRELQFGDFAYVTVHCFRPAAKVEVNANAETLDKHEWTIEDVQKMFADQYHSNRDNNEFNWSFGVIAGRIPNGYIYNYRTHSYGTRKKEFHLEHDFKNKESLKFLHISLNHYEGFWLGGVGNWFDPLSRSINSITATQREATGNNFARLLQDAECIRNDRSGSNLQNAEKHGLRPTLPEHSFLKCYAYLPQPGFKKLFAYVVSILKHALNPHLEKFSNNSDDAETPTRSRHSSRKVRPPKRLTASHLARLTLPCHEENSKSPETDKNAELKPKSEELEASIIEITPQIHGENGNHEEKKTVTDNIEDNGGCTIF